MHIKCVEEQKEDNFYEVVIKLNLLLKTLKSLIQPEIV